MLLVEDIDGSNWLCVYIFMTLSVYNNEFKKEQLRKLEEKKAQEEAKAKAKAEEEERKRKEEEKAKKEAEKAAKEEAKKQGAFEQLSLFDNF